MAAFLKTVSFNRADFKNPPVPAVDPKTGRESPVFEKDIQQDDCRLKFVSEGAHRLIVGLRVAEDANLYVTFSVFSGDFSLITKKEIPLAALVREYEAIVPFPKDPPPTIREGTEALIPKPLPPADAEKIRVAIDPVLRESLGKWFHTDGDAIFKMLCEGLIRAIWDLRRAAQSARRFITEDGRFVGEDPFDGRHRSYHEHRSS